MLHLKKLCVGVDSIDELRTRQRGRSCVLRHDTRYMPRRRGEILGDGVHSGSLYWVIGGLLCVRQRITGLESLKSERRCRILLDSALVLVQPRPSRPFQGWRYLDEGDAPADLDSDFEHASGLDATLRSIGVGRGTPERRE